MSVRKWFFALILITGATIYFSGCALMRDVFFPDGGNDRSSTEPKRGNDVQGGHRH